MHILPQNRTSVLVYFLKTETLANFLFLKVVKRPYIVV